MRRLLVWQHQLPPVHRYTSLHIAQRHRPLCPPFAAVGPSSSRYAKINIDIQAKTTCEAVGLAPPPQLDELPGLAACKLAEIQAAAEAQKAAVLVTLHPAKAFADAKSEQVYAQAERLTQATAEYITAQRNLVATVLADAAETTKASIATRIDPVQAFVKQTLDDSATFEVSTSYRLSAHRLWLWGLA